MIRFVRGKIVQLGLKEIIVDNNGIGYLIKASSKTINSYKLNEEGTIYTYMNVSENDMSLFGFTSNEEISIFTLLISVSGVGPKIALDILDMFDAERLIVAIVNEDVDTITKAKGIGKKTAQRLILELKDKMSTGENFVNDAVANDILEIDYKNEAIEALIALGYSKNESIKVVLDVYKENMTTEDIIKGSLSKFV